MPLDPRLMQPDDNQAVPIPMQRLQAPSGGAMPAVARPDASPAATASPDAGMPQKVPVEQTPVPSPVAQRIEAHMAAVAAHNPRDPSLPILAQAHTEAAAQPAPQHGFLRNFGVDLLQNIGAQFAPGAEHAMEARTAQTAHEREAEQGAKERETSEARLERGQQSEEKYRNFEMNRPQTIEAGGQTYQVQTGPDGKPTLVPLGSPKPIEVPQGGSLIDPTTHQPVYQSPERPVSVAPGGSLVEPSTGAVKFTAPNKQPTDFTSQTYEEEKAKNPNLTREQFLEDKEARSADRAADSQARAFAHQEAMNKERESSKVNKTVDGAIKNARDIDALEQEQREILSQVEKSGKRGIFSHEPEMNGPQSMQFLANHMALTVGRIKGARTGKDLIDAHIHARDLDEGMNAIAQRVTSGGVLTYEQAKQMLGTTGVKRGAAWREAQALAQDAGQDISDKMPPDLGGGKANAPAPAQGGGLNVPSPEDWLAKKRGR